MLVSYNKILILCPVLLAEHQTESQGLLATRGFSLSYLETFQQVAAGFVRSTLGGLNLLDHRTHKDTVLVHDGGTS